MGRKNIRLKEYDYSKNGAYFITICTYNHKKTLSKICRGDPCGRPNIEYSILGELAKDILLELPNRYDVKLDYYVIMPNHVHMILFVEKRATTRVVAYNEIEDFISSFFTLRQRRQINKNDTIGNIVGAYKSLVANEWLRINKEKGIYIDRVWQRNYYEHVIRNERDLYEIRKYIDDNPIKWELDKYYNEV